MANVIMHMETLNIRFLNDIVWSFEVGDNWGDRLDTKRKAKQNIQRITSMDINHILQLVGWYAGWKVG